MTNATIRAHMGAECVKPRLLVEKGVAESGPTSHQVDGGVVVVVVGGPPFPPKIYVILKFQRIANLELITGLTEMMFIHLMFSDLIDQRQ